MKPKTLKKRFLNERRVPYRIYTDAEIDQFLKEDRLPKRLAKKVKGRPTS